MPAAKSEQNCQVCPLWNLSGSVVEWLRESARVAGECRSMWIADVDGENRPRDGATNDERADLVRPCVRARSRRVEIEMLDLMSTCFARSNFSKNSTPPGNEFICGALSVALMCRVVAASTSGPYQRRILATLWRRFRTVKMMSTIRVFGAVKCRTNGICGAHAAPLAARIVSVSAVLKGCGGGRGCRAFTT